jgi:acetyl-CoA carboxylase beta subunit
MGINLISGCHKCRKKVFHFRMEENKTLIPFYDLHYKCMSENILNVVTLEDQIQEEDWMDEYEDQWKYDDVKREYLIVK